MKIVVDEPFTVRQTRLFLLFCMLAIACIVVGMHFLRPILDRQSRNMSERRLGIERQFRENHLRAICEAAIYPDPACAKYHASK